MWAPEVPQPIFQQTCCSVAINYRGVFNLSSNPVRVCCDVNNLPIRSDSLPFVFCYETLHHFPTPTPIVAEVYRVIRPGGYFWFDEEPYRRVLHWNLYEGRKDHSVESRQRGPLRKMMDRLFARTTCNELDYGIIENHEIPTSEWRTALSPFYSKDVWLQPSPRLNLKAKLFKPFSLKYWIAYLTGGRITALCQKQPGSAPEIGSIFEALICPSCRISGKESSLHQDDSSLACSECRRRYPVVDGVAFLFEYAKFSQLYPELFQSLQTERIKE